MQQNTAHRKHTTRSLTALGTAGMVAGLLLGAVPAHAATLQAALYPDHVEFLGNENNADVSGPVKFSIYPDGTWNIYSSTRNGRPARRHVHWTCVVTVALDSMSNSTSVSTPTVTIRRKRSHTFNEWGANTNFAANYDSIRNPGLTSVNCDIHFG